VQPVGKGKGRGKHKGSAEKGAAAAKGVGGAKGRGRGMPSRPAHDGPMLGCPVGEVRRPVLPTAKKMTDALEKPKVTVEESSESVATDDDSEGMEDWKAFCKASSLADAKAAVCKSKVRDGLLDVPGFPNLKQRKIGHTVNIYRLPDLEKPIGKLCWQVPKGACVPTSCQIRCSQHAGCTKWKNLKDIPCDRALHDWLEQGAHLNKSDHLAKFQVVMSAHSASASAVPA